VEQVKKDANELYGIQCNSFTGKFSDYNASNFASYNSADSIAITTYSAIFNKYSRFDESDILIFDDSHNASSYVLNNWTLNINKSKNENLFYELVDVLKDVVDENTYGHLCGSIQSDNNWVNMLPWTSLDLIKSKIVEIISRSLNSNTSGSNYYSWENIQDHISACNLYMNKDSIVICPQIPPCNMITSFSNAKKRIYMSATIGKSGEIERIFGLENIKDISLDPANIPSIGRRMFVFPDIFYPDDNTNEKLFTKLHEINKHSLALVKSTSAANDLENIILQNNNNTDIFNGQDLEERQKQFISNPDSIAILANRYDGVNFSDNLSHLLLLKDLPRYQNLQEMFFSSKLKAAPLLDESLKNRITQAVGRCTRGTNDFSVVIIEGRDLQNILTSVDKRNLFSPELRAEILIGYETSNQVKNFEDLLETSKNLLNPTSDDWKDLNSAIIKKRKTYSNIESDDSINNILKSISTKEVKFEYSVWNNGYSKAESISQAIINTLSEENNDKLKGLLMYWKYLNISIRIRNSNNNRNSLIDESIDQLIEESYLLPWFKSIKLNPSTQYSIDGSASVLLNKNRIASMIDTIEKNISQNLSGEPISKRKSIINIRFQDILKRLSPHFENNGISYEKALIDLGSVLGFRTENSMGQAAPDPWFYLDGNSIIVSEAKIYKSNNQIPVKHIRESKDHPLWLQNNENLKAANITNIFISNISTIDHEASLLADNTTRYINTTELLHFAEEALKVAEKLYNSYTTEGDIMWNEYAMSTIKDSVIDPESIEKKINSLELVKNLPSS